MRGKVDLVTGRLGIGRAVCKCLVQEDATVASTHVKGHEDRHQNPNKKDAQDTLKLLKEAKSPDAKDPTAIRAHLHCRGDRRAEAGKSLQDQRLVLLHDIDIINTTSVATYKGNPKLLGYTATKGSNGVFTRGLALQLVEKCIHVIGVAPGPMSTPLIPASFKEEEVSSFGQGRP
ncbi:hypothetical protein Ancab_024152 [Ancistrocladus abbreviatus]